MKYVLSLAVISMMTGLAQATLIKKNIEYREGSTVLEGYLVYNDKDFGPRPGVIVIPDWMGPSAFARGRADELAKLGYIAIMADIYGKGVRPKDGQEAAQISGSYKSNRPLLRARAQAALDRLLQDPNTDPSRVAVLGYCFGGTAALELARSGAPLSGVVTFHGGLDTPTPMDAKNIKGKVLAMTGADDPYVPLEQVDAFEKEMKDAGVNWEIVRYSGAVHAFAIPSAGNDNSKGAAYNAQADHRSWQRMKDFFNELFKTARHR